MVLKTWKKNKWRSDLRKYTREFEKKFKGEVVCTEVGRVYAGIYRDSKYPTDKHHFTPIFLSFGRFRDEDGIKYVRGVNLLYLNTTQCIEILEETHRFLKMKPDARVPHMLKVHEKFMKIFPYAFKNFEEKKIFRVSEVDKEEWGIIPLLKKNLWGNFNPVALNEDFRKENQDRRRVPRKKMAESLPKVEESKEDATELVDNITELGFDEESDWLLH